MDEGNQRRLNEHKLYVHGGARRAIDAARREGQVGSYPTYLVGLAMREHRHGPAVAALLTLPDGGVLHARARSTFRRRWRRSRVSINGSLGEDIDFLPARELERYRRFFYQDPGGFWGPCLEPGLDIDGAHSSTLEAPIA